MFRASVGQMRGVDHQQGGMFSYLSPETRVRQDHPLRAIRNVVDEVLGQLSPLFAAMYSATGRPSIAPGQGVTSGEHFTVDGTLIEAWASLKSFQRKEQSKGAPPDDPGNPTVNFHGEKRCNQTHESTTDADAKLARKGDGKEAQLSFQGNLLVENRNGLIVNTELFQANGTAERDAALVMLEQLPGMQPVTVGGDKG